MISDADSFGTASSRRAVTGDEEYSSPLEVADVDGDGTDEIVVHATAKSSTLQVFEVEDGEVSAGVTWANDPGADPDEGSNRMITSDVNGDGLADAVLLHTAEGGAVTIDVATSTGTSFSEPRRWAAPECLNKDCKESWHMIGRAL